jgi:hypothetical protein
MIRNLQIVTFAAALVSGIYLTPNVQAAESPTSPLKVAILPLERWQIRAAEGDKVSLAEKENSVSVSFDVEINKAHQQGHRTHNRKTFDVVLKQPAPLPDNADRVLFEALNNQMTTAEMPEDAVQLWPLVRDASGEVLAYIPSQYPTLSTSASTGVGRWSRAMTANFYSGEAGGATSDIYEASGGDGNSWPDGNLSFLGFRVIVQRPQMGRKSGNVAISDIEVTRGQLPTENPYLYADAVLKEAGRYRFAGEVATEFQSLPIRGFEQTIEYSPQSLASGRQRLTVPLGKEGDYWLNYAVTDAKGTVLTSRDMRFHMVGNTALAPSPAITASTPPVGNYVRINPERTQGGVYASDEPMNVAVRVFAKGKPNLNVSWRLLQYAYNTELEKGQQTVQFGGAPFKDIQLSLKGQGGRDAYRLRLDVLDGNTKIDEEEYILGRRTDFSKPRMTRPGLPVNRKLLKQSAYFRATYLAPESNPPKTEDELLAHFEKTLDDARSMTHNWTYMLDVAEMEILPGVYDFAVVDRVIDAAADRGVSLTFRVAHADNNALFRWVRYSRQHNYDGLEIPENYYGGFALTDAQYLEVWHRLNRALFDRYREHRAFQGYYLMQPAGEATVQDKPWLGIVAGYEKPSIEAFRKYLQNNLGLSLEQLNTRWKANYKSWGEVVPPAPNFKLGKQADLSMPWIDFSNFKIGIERLWFQEATKRIRSYDQEHVIIAYGGPGDPKLTGLVDYFHNGGNHFLQNLGSYVDAWEKGEAGWISEPHHPTRWAAYGDLAERGWVLDWTVWVATAQAAGGGANLHLYYSPDRPTLVTHYGDSFSYDRFQKFKPIMDELQKIELLDPTIQVATLQGKLTMATKHRTIFSPRMEDLKRWFELLDVDSIPREALRADHADRYKLLLPNIIDEVMPEADIRLLDKIVRENGAKMIITANTGKYSPERGNEAFQLLKQLGINAPTGSYIENKAGVVAPVATDSALFKKGENISFFTLAQMQEDAQSKEIRDAFWKYPYRWIPQTNYFGYYRDNKTTNGEVLARFSEGGVAVSSHKVGKGEVVVFWGTPDYRPAKLGSLMGRAATWAGITNPRTGNPIPFMVEGHAKENGRHYVLLFQDTPGTYTQRIPTAPDGEWFLTDMVSDRRIGSFTGADLRTKGVPLDYLKGASPLQILRMVPMANMEAGWKNKPLAAAAN